MNTQYPLVSYALRHPQSPGRSTTPLRGGVSPARIASPTSHSLRATTVCVCGGRPKQAAILNALGQSTMHLTELEQHARLSEARERERRVQLEAEIHSLRLEVFRLNHLPHADGGGVKTIHPLHGTQSSQLTTAAHSASMASPSPRATSGHALLQAGALPRSVGSDQKGAILLTRTQEPRSPQPTQPQHQQQQTNPQVHSIDPLHEGGQHEQQQQQHVAGSPIQQPSFVYQSPASPQHYSTQQQQLHQQHQQQQQQQQHSSPTLTDDERARIREEAEFAAELRAAALFQQQELRWQEELRDMHNETQRLTEALELSAARGGGQTPWPLDSTPRSMMTERGRDGSPLASGASTSMRLHML